MCGRFTQRLSWRELHELLGLIGTPQNLRPRYNVAPGQTIATVRVSEGGRRLSMLRWGLVPAWAREPNIGYKMINARSETAHQKPSFRAAFKARRCLIPADGFYEWKREGKAKQPYLIGLKEGGGFVFAGLWESWRVPGGLTLTGNCPEKVRLDESMDQVIGGDAFLGAIQGDVAGTVEIPVQNIIGAIDPIGGSTLTARPG